MESVRDKLDKWSREELIGLVERMVHRDYALVAMIDTPPPGRGQRVDTAQLTEQIDVAFQPAMRGGWRESMALAPQMEDMADLGFHHLEHGETEAALAAFSTVSTGILNRLDQICEDESEVGISVDRCMEGLEVCLGRADQGSRREVLDAIVDQTILGAPWGLGHEGRALLANQTTSEERLQLAEGVESRLAGATTEEAREMLGRLALRLRGQADDTAQVDKLRRAGDRPGLTRALLNAHRPDEARKVLEEGDDGAELAELAALFTDHGYLDHAYHSLERRLRYQSRDDCELLLPVFRWLLRHAEGQRREPGSRSRWAEAIFLAEPSIDHWMLMRDHVPFSRRNDIRRKLELDQHWELVTDICLAEKRYQWAVNRWREIDDKTVEVCRMGATIAEGLAEKKPKVAANLWLGIAYQMVDHGEIREAIDFVTRGRDALIAGRHPILAKRHVAFSRKHVGDDHRVGLEMERAAL
ncbi:MAG: hypothetical protein JRH11_13590 [Deltaproteobacteria bacterium]|nr:hypothetical protein [Deltaproteobacteria bacterium]